MNYIIYFLIQLSYQPLHAQLNLVKNINSETFIIPVVGEFVGAAVGENDGNVDGAMIIFAKTLEIILKRKKTKKM